jgi:hypothetical protein
VPRRRRLERATAGRRRVNRRIHDIADAMAGRGHQWPDESGSHRDHAARAEVMAKAFADWYARRHGREPRGEAVRWLAGDWVTGTLPGYENAVSPHRVRALLAYIDDDWLPEEPATATAYKLLPEWVRWRGEQADVPGPLIERSVAIAERRQPDASDCSSFRFRRYQVARRSVPGAIRPNGPCWQGRATSLERGFQGDEARRMICCHQVIKNIMIRCHEDYGHPR